MMTPPEVPDGSRAPAAGGYVPRRAEVERQRRARIATLRRDLEARRDAAGPSGAWVLELGCGHGHFLAAFARAHPALQCLGVDRCLDRIDRAIRKRERASLDNLHFLRAYADEVIAAVPPDMRFARLFILFPDPWPKRRHRKNRLVSEPFLDRLSAIAAAGADLFFRTDSRAYFDEVRGLLEDHGAWQLRATQAWDFEWPTVFQQRASAHHSLAARRTAASARPEANTPLEATPRCEISGLEGEKPHDHPDLGRERPAQDHVGENSEGIELQGPAPRAGRPGNGFVANGRGGGVWACGHKRA